MFGCQDPNWLFAVMEDGTTGYVPSNYISKNGDLDSQLAEKTLAALQKNAHNHNEMEKKAVRYVLCYMLNLTYVFKLCLIIVKRKGMTGWPLLLDKFEYSFKFI